MGAVQEGTKKRRKAGADDGAKDSSTAIAACRVAVKNGISRGSLNGSAAEQPMRGRRENTEEIKSKKRRRMAAAAAASSACSSPSLSSSSSSSAPSGEASRGAGSSGAKASPAAAAASTANKMKKASAAAAPAAAAPGGGEDLVAGMVSRQLLRRALAGLTQFVLKRSSSSSNDSRGRQPTPLLQEPGSETVSLMVSLRQIPTHFKKTPILIELPHSLLDNNSEVCLIVKDPQRKWKDILSSQVTSKQQPLLIPHITRVIGVKKLKKKFPTYKDRRMLCAAFDLFLVDKKVLNQAYEALGKSFAQAKKLPLPVRLSSTNPRPWLDTALRSTAFFLPRGPSIAVKIGRACMQQQQLEENACAALQALQQFFSDPTNKWRNTIHTVAVQATDAPALPLFVHPAYAGAAAAAAAQASAAAAAAAKHAAASATTAAAAAAGVSGGSRGPAAAGAGGGSSGGSGGGRPGIPPREGKTKEGRKLLQRVKKGDGFINKKAAAATKKKNAKKMKKKSQVGAAAASPATTSAGRKTGKGGKKHSPKK